MTRSRSLVVLSALMAILLTTSLLPAQDLIARRPKPDTASQPAGLPKVVQGGNDFAVELYQKLDKKDNAFFSPNSVHTALAMLYAGARGDTAKQMAASLHYDLEGKELHESMGALIDMLNPGEDKDRPYELTVANALWPQQGMKMLDEFTSINAKYYKAGLTPLDFAKSEDARATINKWVEDSTHEKIKDLMPKGVITADTRLVLTNAIYFKGKWDAEFDKKLTEDGDFHTTKDKSVKTAMMHMQHDQLCTDDADSQVLSLPYKARHLSMVIVLPKAVDGLADIEKGLTGKALTAKLMGMQSHPVTLTLPRFKLTCEYPMSDPLKALGMKDAFNQSAADLSGIDGAKDLFVSAVVHKAFVEVNEEGTEAAAATGIAVATLSVREPQKPVEFKADHPFLFIIRHNATGAILFMGRVGDPSAKAE